MGSVFPLCAETKQGAGLLFRSRSSEKQTDGEAKYEELCGRSEASASIKNRQELLLAVQRAMELVGEDPQQKSCLEEWMAGDLNCSARIQLGWIACGTESTCRGRRHASFDRRAVLPLLRRRRHYAAKPYARCPSRNTHERS